MLTKETSARLRGYAPSYLLQFTSTLCSLEPPAVPTVRQICGPKAPLLQILNQELLRSSPVILCSMHLRIFSGMDNIQLTHAVIATSSRHINGFVSYRKRPNGPQNARAIATVQIFELPGHPLAWLLGLLSRIDSGLDQMLISASCSQRGKKQR